MRLFILVFLVWWSSLYIQAEVRTIMQDDYYSVQKRDFLKKLQNRKPVYTDLFSSWKDIVTYEVKKYQVEMIPTRDYQTTLASDLYYIIGDANGTGGEFQCEDNLCPIIFGVKKYSGSSHKTREYFNSNQSFDFTVSEWIVLELKTPSEGILHFMERNCSLMVKKDETKFMIIDKEKCENGDPLDFIATEYYPPHLFKASFDCDVAKETSEKIICSYSQLADLDLRVDAYYQKILPYYPPIKVKQIEWLKERNTCEVSRDCLLNLMTQRSQKLSAMVADLIEKRIIR